MFIPTGKPEDWKPLLAEPDKHWKRGYSAKAFAYSWQEANGFPECVRNVFKKSGVKLFQNKEIDRITLKEAKELPEYEGLVNSLKSKIERILK